MASKVHRVRFYNPKPQPINCASFNKNTKLIALARGDASIEVWDLNKAPYLTRFIPGVENSSVEALGWVGDRLLSTGLTGALIEWDIGTLTQKKCVLLTGYAAWCLDVNSANTLVAVGTEQGYVNLYSVENDDIVYVRLFDKQDGRIMCCKFDKTGTTLVTGSIDSIRVWNVESGHAITRMSVTRRKKEVIVWSLAVLSNNIIVSGDSQGRLTFWDGNLGEEIESFSTHKADVLTIAVSDNEKNLYCSGLDPTINIFVQIIKGSGTQWVKSVQRHIHEHDVKALICNDNQLISLGVDGYLTFSKYPPKWVMRIPPIIPTPQSSVCAKRKLLLLRYSNYLEVWKLGSNATSDTGDVMLSGVTAKKDEDIQRSNTIEQDSAQTVKNGSNHTETKVLKLSENPIKILAINTKHKKLIQCCEISPSGQLVVYATDSDIRMLKIQTDDIEDDQSNVSVSKVMITGLTSPCDHIAFTSDSSTMVAHCKGILYILQVDPEAGANVVQTLPLDNYFKNSSIIHLKVSPQSSGPTYIVLADTSGVIVVFVENKKRFGHHVTLPKYQSVPCALTIDQSHRLIIVYTDQTVLEYDIPNKKFTDWPKGALPSEWRYRNSAVRSVTAHPKRNAVVFQDDSALWIIERTFESDDQPYAKRKSINDDRVGLKVIPIKYAAGFHWIGDEEAVLVEILPEKIVAQLPPPVQTNNWHVRPA